MKGWDLLEKLATALAGHAHLTVLLGHSSAFCPVNPERLSGATILHGLADRDMPGLYRAATWLLSTSRWEGFGLAIAEALACGTPVMLPAGLGTAPELLASGGGATYRNPDDVLTALAMPAPTGTLPPRFDWDANAATSLRLYTSLTAAKERPCAS
jgi:D-inositol-3-phosphate glycosyltransferase